MIHVVHIVEDLKIGGLERVIAAISTGLNGGKFKQKVWCLARGGEIYDELQDKGVDIELLNMRSHRDILFFSRLCRKLRKENIHIVHTHGYTATTMGRLAGICARTPVILSHMHTTCWDYTPKQLVIEKMLSFFTSRIICCSQAVSEFAVKGEKINSNKLEVIYNGVDPEKYANSMSDHNDHNDTYRVGCVASLSPHKGHRYLLEAAKVVVNEIPSRVKFVLVGSGILRKELREYADSLGISSSIEFKDPVSDIVPLLSSFDLVVLPSSEREGLGLAIIEAMAAGKPVIGTSIGGIPEVIENGTNGLLVPPKDAVALSKAILHIMSDKKRADKMSEKGRAIVHKKFSTKEMLGKIEDLYQRLLNDKIGKTKA